MGTWNDVIKRRKEGDPLMKGGKYRPVKNEPKNIKCPRPGCQSKNILLDTVFGTCFDCEYVWKRRIY